MHTGMWEHPATRGNVEVAAGRGAPSSSDRVDGRARPRRRAASAAWPSPRTSRGCGRPWHGPVGRRSTTWRRRVLVTAGPTHEPIDPVRFIGNRSSGRMGVAVAAEAARRGARVHLVLGPGTVAPPPGVEVDASSRLRSEMRAGCHAHVDAADAVVMAAAVADFRPKGSAPGKLKKDDGLPELVLEPTPDILASWGSARARVGAGRLRGGDRATWRRPAAPSSAQGRRPARGEPSGTPRHRVRVRDEPRGDLRRRRRRRAPADLDEGRARRDWRSSTCASSDAVTRTRLRPS